MKKTKMKISKENKNLKYLINQFKLNKTTKTKFLIKRMIKIKQKKRI